MKRRIKFRAPGDTNSEQDMEVFVREANLIFASLDEIKRPNVEAWARRPHHFRGITKVMTKMVKDEKGATGAERRY